MGLYRGLVEGASCPAPSEASRERHDAWRRDARDLIAPILAPLFLHIALGFMHLLRIIALLARRGALHLTLALILLRLLQIVLRLVDIVIAHDRCSFAEVDRERCVDRIMYRVAPHCAVAGPMRTSF